MNKLLAEWNMLQLQEIFNENSIDSEVLLCLNDDDLKQLIPSMGLRAKLRSKILFLKQNTEEMQRSGSSASIAPTLSLSSNLSDSSFMNTSSQSENEDSSVENTTHRVGVRPRIDDDEAISREKRIRIEVSAISLNVEELLKNAVFGRFVLEKREEALSYTQRKLIVKIIINEMMRQSTKLTAVDFKMASRKICLLFTEEENEAIYYVPSSNRKPARGLLVNKYASFRRKLPKVGKFVVHQGLHTSDVNEEQSVSEASDLNERLSLDNPLNPMKHESPKISVSYNCPSMPIDGSNLAGSSFEFPDQNKEIFSDQDNNHIDVKSEPHFEVNEELLDENARSNVGVSSPNSSPSSRQTSPSPPGMTGPYLLKKETHCHNILDELLKDETYADVTLTAEGKTIKAHRIILSLSSKYFRTVLSQEPNAKNVILFRDMKFQELRDIINFIYTGEVTVDASDLDSFMKTADVLEVTSLCNSHKNFPKEFNLGSTNSAPTQSSSKRTHSESTLPPPKVRKTSNDGAKSSKRSYSSINECTEPTTSVSLNIKEEETEEMPELAHIEAECLLSVPSSDTPPKSCVCCPSTFENVDIMFQHIDDAHEKEEMFPCEVCVQIFSTSKLFNKHLKVCAPKSDQ